MSLHDNGKKYFTFKMMYKLTLIIYLKHSYKKLKETLNQTLDKKWSKIQSVYPYTKQLFLSQF